MVVVAVVVVVGRVVVGRVDDEFVGVADATARADARLAARTRALLLSLPRAPSLSTGRHLRGRRLCACEVEQQRNDNEAKKHCLPRAPRALEFSLLARELDGVEDAEHPLAQLVVRLAR